MSLHRRVMASTSGSSSHKPALTTARDGEAQVRMTGSTLEKYSQFTAMMCGCALFYLWPALFHGVSSRIKWNACSVEARELSFSRTHTQTNAISTQPHHDDPSDTCRRSTNRCCCTKMLMGCLEERGRPGVFQQSPSQAARSCRRRWQL